MLSLRALRYFDERHADSISVDGEDGDGGRFVSRVGNGAGVEEECPANTTEEPPVRVAENEDVRSEEATLVARNQFLVEGIPRLC